MVARKSSKLPEGVGKRIIEKLKTREYEVNADEPAVAEPEEENAETIEYSVEQDEQDVSEVEAEIEITSEEQIQQEDNEEAQEDYEINYSCTPKAVKKKSKKQAAIYEEPEVYEENIRQTSGVSDIDTLLNLISQLPSGVTKQTGALIIRQTMEALGISMNKVLGDAQSVQEELEHSIRNNVNVIEEYRTKIKILEQEIQKFRKKAHELEDIISLFILSDEQK